MARTPASPIWASRLMAFTRRKTAPLTSAASDYQLTLTEFPHPYRRYPNCLQRGIGDLPELPYWPDHEQRSLGRDGQVHLQCAGLLLGTGSQHEGCSLRWPEGCTVRTAFCQGHSLRWLSVCRTVEPERPPVVYSGNTHDWRLSVCLDRHLPSAATESVQTAWAGARYEDGPWSLTGAYYFFSQNSYLTSATGINAGGFANNTCAGQRIMRCITQHSLAPGSAPIALATSTRVRSSSTIPSTGTSTSMPA